MGQVVVIGAGYAGVRAAKAAARHGAQVTTIDHDGRHHFGPRLPAVAAGGQGLGDGAASFESLTGLPVQVGTVRRIDAKARTVTLATGTVHHWDALVVTVGAIPSRPPIPGLDEHAIDLKTADDALHLQRATERSKGVVVVGGGATGVQIAGELAAHRSDLEVDLVEQSTSLLPELPGMLGSRAASLLRKRGVRVHLAAEVSRFRPGGVDLADGTELDGTPVWAGGFDAIGNQLLPGAEEHDGRIRVRDTLEVPGWANVFVAGDAAAHVDLIGRPLGMSAQVAVQAGKAAGRNAALVASGRDPIPALLYDLGRVVMLGGGRGVARLGPVPVGMFGSDRLVPLLHEAIDLRHLFDTGGLRAIVRHGRGQDDRSDRGSRPDLRLVEGGGDTTA